MRSSSKLLLSVLLLGLLVGFGCEAKKQPDKPAAEIEKGTGHDPHDVPITEADVQMPTSYGEAVDRIAGYRDTIRAAIEAGTPTKAHRSLDELDIVLRKLAEIAREHDVPRDQWETVNTTARELRNRFNKLHSAIDAGEKPDYAQDADQISKEIDRLKTVKEEMQH